MQCLRIVIETFFSVKNQQYLENNNIMGWELKSWKNQRQVNQDALTVQNRKPVYSSLNREGTVPR